MDRREVLDAQGDQRMREPPVTWPISQGAKYAEELGYKKDGVDLIRIIQVLQEGLTPETWSWGPDHVAAKSNTIDVSTADRYSNRLAANDMVRIQPAAERTYALTDEGREFATCTMYRYFKTMKTDVKAYGLPNHEVIVRAFDQHMGMNIQQVMRRVTQPHFQKNVRLNRFNIPSHIYDAYEI